jgi:hypothetical protein
MFEVPAYDQAATVRRCQGDMQGIGCPFFTHDACVEISLLQGNAFRLDGHHIGKR